MFLHMQTYTRMNNYISFKTKAAEDYPGVVLNGDYFKTMTKAKFTQLKVPLVVDILCLLCFVVDCFFALFFATRSYVYVWPIAATDNCWWMTSPVGRYIQFCFPAP